MASNKLGIFEILLAGIDYNGDPLAGAKVYFYASGSTNPQYAFLDTTYTNPTLSVTLDGQGRASVFGYGIYRIVIKNAAETQTIYTFDDILVGNQQETSVTTSTNYLIDKPIDILLVDATNGPITINLASYTSFTSAITIKKTDTTSNQVTIDAYGTELIDAAQTKVLTLVESQTAITPDFLNGKWVSLSSAYVLKSGDTISGTLTVEGLFRANANAYLTGTINVIGNLDANSQVRAMSADDKVSMTAITHAHPVIQATTSLDVAKQLLINPDGGNVGIGTTDPLASLQIGTLTPVGVANPNILSLGATYSNVAGTNPKFRLYDAGAAVYGIGVSSGIMEYIVPGGAVQAWYNGSAEKMRLTTNGFFAIGTTTATARLTVADQLPIHLQNTDFSTGVAGSGCYIGFGAASGNTYTSFQAFKAGNTAGSILALNPNGGNVGIGTITPDKLFTVKGAVGIEATNSTNHWAIYTHTDNTLRVNYQGISDDEIIIDSSGNVTVGTMIGTAKLTVASAATANTFDANTESTWVTSEIFADSLAANSARGIKFGTKTSTKGCGIVCIATNTTGGDAHLAFLTATGNVTTERVRVNANGNVGIGTTNPGRRFEIHSDSTPYVLRLNTGAVSGPIVEFMQTDVRKAYIQQDSTSGFLLVEEDNLPMQFYTNNIARLFILNTGDIEATGSITATNFIGNLNGAQWVNVVDSSVSIPDSTGQSINLRSGALTHRQYRYSVYSAGANVVQTDHATLTCCYLYKASTGQDQLFIVNRAGSTQTFYYRVDVWE